MKTPQDTSALIHFIKGRRSIRAYGPETIDDDTVKSLLEAAMAAPSAAAKDPWRFVVIRNKRVLQEVAEALPNGKMIASAPLGIVVCGDLHSAHDQQLSYMLQDCSAAIQNLLLAVHAHGLGACWLGIHPRPDRIQKITATLELPSNIVPIGGIAIGHPGETKEARTRYKDEFVHFEKW